MKIGLIARADSTGLGVQTHQFYRHMHPHKTLAVDLSHLNRQKNDFSKYPGASVLKYMPYPDVRSDPHPDTKQAIDEFLDDLDLVFTCETVYDYYLVKAARRRGIKVVLQYNFELLDHIADRRLPNPDLFMAPSLWRMKDVATPNKVFLPVPVDREAIPPVKRTKAETFLHVGGIPAMCDRNGTQVLVDAWDQVKEPAKLIITTQTGQYRVRDRRRIRLQRGLVPNYATLYSQGDAFVLPRKFGGLCLPLNEAMSAAMPIVMTDLSPQNGFLHPSSLVPAAWDHAEMTKTKIDIYEPDRAALAEKIDELHGNSALVEELSDWSDHIASLISWEALAPVYWETFYDVVSKRHVKQRFGWENA